MKALWQLGSKLFLFCFLFVLESHALLAKDLNFPKIFSEATRAITVEQADKVLDNYFKGHEPVDDFVLSLTDRHWTFLPTQCIRALLSRAKTTTLHYIIEKFRRSGVHRLRLLVGLVAEIQSNDLIPPDGTELLDANRSSLTQQLRNLVISQTKINTTLALSLARAFAGIIWLVNLRSVGRPLRSSMRKLLGDVVNSSVISWPLREEPPNLGSLWREV